MTIAGFVVRNALRKQTPFRAAALRIVVKCLVFARLVAVRKHSVQAASKVTLKPSAEKTELRLDNRGLPLRENNRHRLSRLRHCF